MPENNNNSNLETRCKEAKILVQNVYECKAKYKCINQTPCDQLMLCGLYFKRAIIDVETQKVREEQRWRRANYP